MIPELGHFALVLAFCVALVQGVLPFAGAATGSVREMAFGRSAAAAQFALVALAFAALAAAFAQNDFSVAYVAEHSNSRLPLFYRLSAVWGGHEGSLLLWVLMLAGWTLAIALAPAALPATLVARALGVLGLVAAGFHAFILFASNPFERLAEPPADGRDLNPLLQDPGLIFHPPMLYMGYVGFSVAFALAIAALAAGRLDAAWARWSRPWTTAAWVFLTLGIALGSVWAYYELGWGGWWFWDPVENASLMPWLVGTALIHSLAVTEKRGALKSWTLLLAIAAFSLSLLGTFLVRSGVLTSVHAFATDPRRGVFILVLLAVTVGGSLALFVARAPRLAAGEGFAPVSREALMLANNALLAAACGTVLLGTLYPLAVDALGLGKLSVGPPYFNAVFVPIALPLLFLVGFAPHVPWRSGDAREVLRRTGAGVALALAGGAALPLAFAHWSAAVAAALALALWVVASAATDLVRRARLGFGALLRQPRAHWGMHLAHVGLAVSAVGIAVSSAYEEVREVRMAPGDTLRLGGYELVLRGVSERRGPNYVASVGAIELVREGRRVAVLEPEKRRYFSSEMPMTEAAIDRGLARDVYVSLGEPLESGAWSVRAQLKPFVNWIWAGALLMAAGGLLAIADRRYRRRREAPAAAAEPLRA